MWGEEGQSLKQEDTGGEEGTREGDCPFSAHKLAVAGAPAPCSMFISEVWPSGVEARAPDRLGQVPALGLTGVESYDMPHLSPHLSPHLPPGNKTVLTPRMLRGFPGKPWSPLLCIRTS